MKKFYLYKKNHLSGQSIETFVRWLKNDFKNIEIINKFKSDKVNIIIENFQESDVIKIKKLKQLYNTKFVLICSEYYNPKANTFNCFELNSQFSFFYVNFIYYLIEILKIFKFKKIIKNNISKKISRSGVKSQNIFLKYLFHILEIHKYKRRYINFKKIENCVDVFLVTHPAIFSYLPRNKKKFVYPYFIKFEKTVKKKIFGFSGSLTKYRYNKFLYLSKKKFPTDFRFFLSSILKLNNKMLFQDNYKKNISNYYTLHLKRSLYWPYISPVRIINSLRRGEIPVICDYYKSNFMKNLCYQLKEINYYSIKNILILKKEINKSIVKKIKIYNKQNKLNLEHIKRIILNIN